MCASPVRCDGAHTDRERERYRVTTITACCNCSTRWNTDHDIPPSENKKSRNNLAFIFLSIRFDFPDPICLLYTSRELDCQVVSKHSLEPVYRSTAPLSVEKFDSRGGQTIGLNGTITLRPLIRWSIAGRVLMVFRSQPSSRNGERANRGVSITRFRGL